MSHHKQTDTNRYNRVATAPSMPKDVDCSELSCRPFRLLAYRQRMRQRKDALKNKRNDYRNMTEAETVLVLLRLDKAWESTRVRFGRVKAKWWMVIFTFVLTVATIAALLAMVWQNYIMIQ